MAGNAASMDTAGTSQVLDSLAEAGTALLRSWTQGKSSIAALEGRLGKGIMGTTFMAAYKARAISLDPVAQALAAEPLKLAGTGRKSVADYQLADEIARDSFQHITKPGN